MDEKTLAAAAAGGDQRAFEQLAGHYRALIYSTAWKVLLNEEDALDVTQMVLIRLSTRIGSWRGEGSFASWVRTMTVRTALNERKRLARHEKATEDDALDHAAAAHDPAPPLSERIESRQRREMVRKAMEQLPPQQRAVLMMRLCEEMRPIDIARELDLPPTQVRSQLFRAIARMKEIFAHHDKTVPREANESEQRYRLNKASKESRNA